MTKTEYLEQMKKYLRRLPHEDYQNTMEYFTEYFDELGDGDVESAIQELGTPKEAAAELLNRLLNERLEDFEEQKKPSSVGKNIMVAILTIFAAPIGLPLLLTALLLVLVGIICVGCVLLCGFIGVFSMLMIAGKLLIRGIVAMAVSFSGALVLIGTAFFGLGCAILFGIFVVYLSKWIGRGIVMLAKNVSKKVRR